MTKYSYTLVLTGASNYINLNRKIGGISGFRVLNIRYTTTVATNVFCIISISNFNDKEIIYGSSSVMKYTKLVLLPDDSASICNYQNLTKENDVEFPEYKEQYITNLQLDILFGKTDGSLTYPNSEISTANPFVVEFEIIGD